MILGWKAVKHTGTVKSCTCGRVYFPKELMTIIGEFSESSLIKRKVKVVLVGRNSPTP